MQGRLIVFDGGEGGGKTTQIQRSLQWLKDSGWSDLLQSKGYIRAVTSTHEPGSTKLGQEIRNLLLDSPTQKTIQDRAELLLYAADRAQHVDSFLRPLLSAGLLILCDRYTSSTIAYQGYGRGLDLSMIEQLNQIATNGLQSDLTLWLDLDVDTSLARMKQRGKPDRIEQSGRSFHQRVRQGFAKLAETHRDRFVRIDANQSEDEVAHQIQLTLSDRFVQWYGLKI